MFWGRHWTRSREEGFPPPLLIMRGAADWPASYEGKLKKLATTAPGASAHGGGGGKAVTVH